MERTLTAVEARDVAAAHALASERGRRLPSEVVEALVAAGFARRLVPARWGGAAGSFAGLAEAVATVGEGCASAAWCASVYAIAGRIGAHLPLEGQAELWADGPDTVIASGIVPSPGARVEQDAEGWLLTGEWPFTSGVHGSAWVIVGALVADAAGGREFRFFAVPRERFAIRPTWANVGLGGTGSDTVVLEGVRVPEHLTFRYDSLLAGEPVGSTAPAHLAPYKLVNGLTFVAPVLGAARGALRHWTGWIGAKHDVTGRPTRERAAVQTALTRAASEVDLAGLLVRRAAEAADTGPYSAEVLARSPRDFAVAADLLAAAAERLLRGGGARAQVEDNPVQRAWRDVYAAAGHVVLQFDAAAAAYAEYAFAAV
ncbi:acyl-CoA dehydrogenase family protein [Kitasatospora terrestris]|uniref:acyl-CoA dehydrogenase family protein n=1 Tax=Kitasatospora terrestris TaxID=258051 RepID=UPI0031EB735E